MKKLYKSRNNKMISGVCAGVAEYFGVDPTLVRLAVVALAIFAGSGLLAYIVCAIIIPEAPVQQEEQFRSFYANNSNNSYDDDQYTQQKHF